MNSYELTFILKPDLSDKVTEDMVVKVKKWIEELKGKVKSSDVWGKRSFSYRILKYLEGYYVIITLDMAPSEVGKLDRKLKLDDSVLRYLLVIKE